MRKGNADRYVNSCSSNTVASLHGQIGIRKNANEKGLSLIAIPVIASFKEIVPESHFEAAMHDLSPESCVNYLTEVCAPQLHLKLLPQFFLFDHLMSIPGATLKRGYVAMHSEIGCGRAPAPARAMSEYGFRRSAVFLRYLVGSQDSGGEKSRLGSPSICAELQEITMHMLERRVGRKCMVNAFYSDSFCEPVYAGMWRYQVGKLDYISQHVWNSASRKSRLSARVALQGKRHQFVLRVGFFADDLPIIGRHYMLRSRPSEDAIRCLYRVKSRIEATGICTLVYDDFIPWDDGFGNAHRKGHGVLPFAIPI